MGSLDSATSSYDDIGMRYNIGTTKGSGDIGNHGEFDPNADIVELPDLLDQDLDIVEQRDINSVFPGGLRRDAASPLDQGSDLEDLKVEGSDRLPLGSTLQNDSDPDGDIG